MTVSQTITARPMPRPIKIVLSLFLIVMLAGCDDRKQNKDATALLPPEPILSPYCEGNVIIKVDGVAFSVPRTLGLYYVDADGTEHRYYNRMPQPRPPHPYRDCDIKELDNLSYALIGPGLYNCTISPISCETTYRRYKKVGEKYQEGEPLKKLPTGILKTTKGREYYFLPQDLAPTGNGEPVTLSCSGHEDDRKDYVAEKCVTKFVNPDGLGVIYEFLRRKYSEDQYLEVHRYWQDRYESMKVQPDEPN